MKRLLLGSALLVLASCAPSLNAQYRVGRIVNTQTGEEGRVLLSGSGSVAGRNAVRVELGQDAYTGEYNVLTSSSAPPRVTIGAGVGFSNSDGPAWYVTGGVRPSDLRDGSLIAKSPNGKVMTCQFVVDPRSHGNGTCTDNAGARYALQF